MFVFLLFSSLFFVDVIYFMIYCCVVLCWSCILYVHISCVPLLRSLYLFCDHCTSFTNIVPLLRPSYLLHLFCDQCTSFTTVVFVTILRALRHFFDRCTCTFSVTTSGVGIGAEKPFGYYYMCHPSINQFIHPRRLSPRA